MITVTGRVVDEAGTPLEGVRVVALGDWLLTTEKLTKPFTVGKDGRFSLTIDGVEGGAIVPSSFRVRVMDLVGRQLTEDKNVPGTVANHDLKDITVQRADKDGLLVTNLTGTAKFVSDGNAIKLLVDGFEAFGRIADDIRGARHSVNVVELFFALPPEFQRSARDEKANLIFKFREPPLVPHDPVLQNQPDPVPRGEALIERNGQLITISDDRPERLLIDDAETDKTIRILLNEPGIGFPEGIFWLAGLTPLAAGLGVGGVAALGALAGLGIPFFPLVLAVTVIAFFAEFIKVKLVLEDVTDVDEAKKYFGRSVAAAAPIVPRITVHGFRQSIPDHGVQHCKMVITDENRAVVVGSPFSQRYYDSPLHKIDDAHRGSNTSDMVHDLSIAVVGPAVRDLYDSFRLYWNEDVSTLEKIPEAPVPAAQTSTEEADTIARVQVVRTLSGKRFAELKGTSEKGILEGYLRAFAAAEHYIYIENQYFTDSGITEGLIEVLKKKKNLELMIVVPIKPDVITYPRRQAFRIQQLREAGGDRVGVFTRWTYDENHVRPWVAPVYIHAKGAVIDDSWATVGSANLDGLSLDYNLLLSPLVFGETMASELNVNVIPPTPGAVHPFAEKMRRRLFAEHLGLLDDDGNPNPNANELNQDRTFKWLADLWRPKAKLALEHVKAAKRERLRGFVLEYPKEDGGSLDTPRRHLAALGVHLKPFTESVVRPITGTRKFEFSTGKWARDVEHDDIKL
jgi:phosphatidylserine/phosphatidylglycerophosphate/cardiolipin synthase-like enzyme